MKRPELRPALLLIGLLSATGLQAQSTSESGHATAKPRGEAVLSPRRAAASAPGEQTRRLLEQQRAGTRASHHDQWLSGDVQREVYRRYVESFGQAIPERFIDDEFSD